jgi:hypothetical protein
MPQNNDSRSQLNSISDQRVDLAAWLQLELELEPAPVLVLAASSCAVSPWAVAAAPVRCPMCGAALVHVIGSGLCDCPRCGAVVDL